MSNESERAAFENLSATDALVRVGSAFANVAFNWSQHPGHVLTERDCKMLKDMQVRWDDARASRAPAHR